MTKSEEKFNNDILDIIKEKDEDIKFISLLNYARKINKNKDKGYYELDLLYAVLARIYPSRVTEHPTTVTRWLITVNTPEGQVSHHFPEESYWLFKRIKNDESIEWDGHTREDKNYRLANLVSIL